MRLFRQTFTPEGAVCQSLLVFETPIFNVGVISFSDDPSK